MYNIPDLTFQIYKNVLNNTKSSLKFHLKKILIKKKISKIPFFKSFLFFKISSNSNDYSINP